MSNLKSSQFVCQRCGTCCRWSGHVLLESQDITRLAAAMGLSEESFIEAHTRLASNRRQLSLKDQVDGSCALLTAEGCSFYDARPDQCKNFPHSWRVAEGCPALEALDKNKLNR